MSYKIKSLIYFSCLVVAIFAYNEIETEQVDQNATVVELNDMDVKTSHNDQLVQLSEEE